LAQFLLSALDKLDEPHTLVALREAVKAQLPRADLLESLLEIAALEQHRDAERLGRLRELEPG
jgi:hypothetical protein